MGILLSLTPVLSTDTVCVCANAVTKLMLCRGYLISAPISLRSRGMWVVHYFSEPIQQLGILFWFCNLHI